MFVLNDDLSISATRGDIVFFSVTAEDDGVAHKSKYYYAFSEKRYRVVQRN